MGLFLGMVVLHPDVVALTLQVRDKMLYSSAKQDLRQGLGLGYFEGEFYANVVTDLSFESLLDSRRSGTGDQLLSEAE